MRVVDREQTGIHHGFGVAISGQRLACRFDGGCDGVADFRLADILRSGDHIADFPGAQRFRGGHIGADHADLDGVVSHADAHHVQFLAGFQFAVNHTDIRDDAAVGVIHRVEDERPRRRFGVPVRSGDIHDDGVQQVGDTLTGFAGDPKHILRLAPDKTGDFFGMLVGFRAGQVDFVEYGDDGQVVVDRHIKVGQGLRLDALRGVHEQHCAFACRQRARYLIGEVHMAWCVNHAEGVFRTIDRPRHAHGLGLDGDATFLLDIHAVKEAVMHLPLRDDAGQLENPVGYGGFSVVDVCNDAEVANQRLIGKARLVFRFNH